MAKKSVGIMTVIIVGIIIAVLAVGAVMYFGGDITKTIVTPPEKVGTCPDSAATVSFSAVSSLAKSTSVSPTAVVKVDGTASAASGTSYPVGSNLEILWNASNYIDKTTSYLVACGGGPITTDMYATDDATLRVFNSDGNAVSNTLSGGATNQTLVPAGGSRNLKVYLDGNDKQSSGDLVIVLEHANDTECDKLTLSGLGGAALTDVPGFYSVNSSGSKAVAYNVPAIVGADTAEGTLGINSKTGLSCGGPIFMTAYSKQAFEDTDGTFKVGIENADDATKYEDTFTFYFFTNQA